jgi:hypothetical protein
VVVRERQAHIQKAIQDILTAVMASYAHGITQRLAGTVQSQAKGVIRSQLIDTLSRDHPPACVAARGRGLSGDAASDHANSATTLGLPFRVEV